MGMPYSEGGAPLPRQPFGGSLLYGEGGASLASMGKSCGLGGSASAQAVSSPTKEVNGYRSFAAALKGRPASLQSKRGFPGFGAPFSLKGQEVTSDCLVGDGVCSRKDNVPFGDSFKLWAFRDTLVHLKWEVTCCFEWVELGLCPVGLVPRQDPEKSVMPNTNQPTCL